MFFAPKEQDVYSFDLIPYSLRRSDMSHRAPNGALGFLVAGYKHLAPIGAITHTEAPLADRPLSRVAPGDNKPAARRQTARS